MKCPLCGCQFREEASGTSCKGCPMSGGCHMIKCPNCGYETPKEPRLIKAIKAIPHCRDLTPRAAKGLRPFGNPLHFNPVLKAQGVLFIKAWRKHDGKK